MGKKVLKRSLVLGALMAFVITGSAWAADIEFAESAFDNSPQVIETSQTIDMKGHDWTITNANGTAITFNGGESEIVNGGNLTISGSTDNHGINGSGTRLIKVNALNINGADHAIRGYGNLELHAANIYMGNVNAAFYAPENNSTYKIISNSLTINSLEDAIKASSGYIGIVTDVLEINVIDHKSEDRGAIVALTYEDKISQIDITATGKAIINGDIRTRGESTVNLEMHTHDSVLTGAAYGGYKDVVTESGNVNLRFNNGATWEVTGDSTITGLAGNDAKINNATTGDVTLTVNNAKWDYSKLGNQATNTVIKDSVINLTGVDLIIESGYTENQYNGIVKNSTINSDSIVTLKQTGHDHAIGYCSDETIFAKEINIISDRESAIYTNSSDKKYLNADKIYLESNFRPADDTNTVTVCAAGVFADDGATVTIEEFKELNVVNNSFVNDDGGYGIVSSGKSNVVISGEENADSSITVNSDGMCALGAFKDGTLIVSADSVDVTTEKFRNSSDARKSGTIAVQGMKDNAGNYYNGASMVINVTKSLKVTDKDKRIGENATSAIKVTDGSLKVNSKADTVIEIDGNITQTAGSIDLALQNDKSSVTGAINTATAGADIAFKNNSVWNNNGESKIAKLTLENGVINQNASENITIGLYSGNGTVNYGANSGNVFINDGSGSLNLAMVGATDMEEVANKISVKEAVASNIKAKIVEPEGDVKGETIAEVDYKEADQKTGYRMGTVGKVVEKVNTKNQSIGEAGVSLKLHWRSHMNDMNKRMGELRNANGEHGVWTRMVRGESEYEGVKAQYNQYQLGYDEKLSVDKRWTVGAAVTFAEGDASYGNGTTEDKSTAFAIYGSKLNNDGTFVDLIARYARIESDLEDATSGKGDYSTNGMSVSAEFGKRIQQGNGLWIEPQVELTYGTVDDAEFQLGGKTVHVGDMDSIIGRVGFSLGKDIKQGNVYARASYLYDFDGETENAFSNANDSRTIADDLGGGWWEVGVGANINLSKATYIYADVEKTFGGEVDTNWQWNLGVRYSF